MQLERVLVVVDVITEEIGRLCKLVSGPQDRLDGVIVCRLDVAVLDAADVLAGGDALNKDGHNSGTLAN